MNGINFTNETKDKVIIGLVGALLGSGVGGGLGVFRYDKFTGSEGRELAGRISVIEREMRQLPPDWLKTDVVRNTINIEAYRERLEHIEGEHRWLMRTIRGKDE